MSKDSYFGSGIEIDTDPPYKLPLDPGNLREADISPGDSVGLQYEIRENFPRFIIGSPGIVDGSDWQVTRKVSRGSGEEAPNIRLPEKIVRAAGLTDCQAFPHPNSDTKRLYIPIRHDTGLDEVSLGTTAETVPSTRRRGYSVVKLPESMVAELPVGDSLFFSVDHYNNNIFFIIDMTPDIAPEGALEITANPNTGRERTSGLSFYFPRPIEKICAPDMTSLRWGRVQGMDRIVGTGR